MTYAVLIPLKATTRGKSRLGLPDGPRAALARAMALDTVAAVRGAAGVSLVLVLTEDVPDADALAGCGVEVVLTDVRGLNETIAEGARLLTARGWTGPVAVLPGDLPFLTAADLAAALATAAGGPGVVADADGTGTTLLAAASSGELRPQFGVGSYRRHRDAGAVGLTVPAASTLHRDVDVLSDLREPGSPAVPGRHTRAVLDGLRGSVDRGSSQVTVLP
ncbi:2-phospho-L-lactate guanylyltransferase [Nakamurella deserti]|uniref:2-phospho-L-lactate guanylyltransferase n=1 Tax=Nakamurella deserti TaxID=2164074 RepID=UPI000DBE8E44|nr:2-phospho-L-lactate guanylyltransferase [Nakamurella deserti]